jgi:hypothetical protein
LLSLAVDVRFIPWKSELSKARESIPSSHMRVVVVVIVIVVVAMTPS